MSQKRTFVLFVERTIAASAAKRMRLGVAFTGMGHQKGVGSYRTQSKRTHPKEDVPMQVGQKSDHQWVDLRAGFLLRNRPFVCKKPYVSYQSEREEKN
jgi:hypothetical protein